MPQNEVGPTRIPTVEIIVGWSTNGPAVFAQVATPLSTLTVAGDTNNPAGSPNTHGPATNRFHHFLPESLNNLVWTNFLAHTNGRSVALWSIWEKPLDFPQKPPIMAWNTNCVAWGMRGLTAISQSWEDEGGKGQAPVTALTRRHGYVRGHSMGPDGFTTNRNGKRIWFVTRANQMILVRVQSAVVRIGGPKQRDYSILQFDQDLPLGIEPLRVVSRTNLVSRYGWWTDIPRPWFQTEQGGNISTGIRGFSVNTFKGGDSGSPDMVPMPGELVFAGGRATSGASQDMQDDINELCRRAHLDPNRYQLQWVDWSKYPEY